MFNLFFELLIHELNDLQTLLVVLIRLYVVQVGRMYNCTSIMLSVFFLQPITVYSDQISLSPIKLTKASS